MTDAHQELLQLLYIAPVGLLKTNLEGEIELANAVAAQLLLPLSADGEMTNLFTILETLLPELRSQVAQFILSEGALRQSLHRQLDLGHLEGKCPKYISITITQVDDDGLAVSMSDVSREVQMAATISESEARLRALLDAAMDAIISIDWSGCITDWNKRAQAMFGWSKEEMVGKTLFDAISTSHSMSGKHADLSNYFALQKTAGLGNRFEFTAVRRSGVEFAAEICIVTFESGDNCHYTAFISDITDRKRADEMVLQLAYSDSLTGLANRALLNDRLSQAILSSGRSNIYCALMLLDLDNFKTINDQHGHHVGDLLLREAAIRITKCVRQADTVARLGGDEFVVLLSNLDPGADRCREKAFTLAEKIRISLSMQYTFKLSQANGEDASTILDCSASIGVVVFGSKSSNQADIIKKADAAMYEAKRAGRNGIMAYKEER